MPKKPAIQETTLREIKPKVAAKPRAPRVKSVTHSKTAAVPVAAGTATATAHEQIAKIAYGYWESRGYQPGGAEQDWLRAEREYLLQA